MKIPFTLDAWLKDESQRVETRDGRLVHNIWRVKEPFYTNNRKAEVCALIDGEEDALVFFEDGKYLPTAQDTDSPFDLFIITPEPELSEFEHAFGLAIVDAPEPEEKEEWYPYIKEKAAELLDIARKEALKDLPRWKRIRDNGCVDADGDTYTDCLCLLKRGWYQVISAGTKVGGEIQYLSVSDLEKLPGFKED